LAQRFVSSVTVAFAQPPEPAFSLVVLKARGSETVGKTSDSVGTAIPLLLPESCPLNPGNSTRDIARTVVRGPTLPVALVAPTERAQLETPLGPMEGH